MIGPIRNSPVILIRSIPLMAILLIIGVAVTIGSGDSMGPIFIVGSLIGIALYCRIWSRTTYTFNDTEIIREKNTLYKNRTTIPYSKIASINVLKNITDRIFGTETLQFNVNSNVNAATPEIMLCVKKDLAWEIHSIVESKIGKSIDRVNTEENVPSILTFTPFDVILHGFLSSSTGAFLLSIVLFIYSIYGLFVNQDAAGGGLIAFFLFAVNTIIPVVSKVIRYFDFRVCRVGDRIYLDHGLVRKYHSEFDIGRVNSVKIQSPLFARLIGKSYLQAEVVGINAVSSEVTPTLCILTSSKKIYDMIPELLPEFLYEGDMHKQPQTAKVPIYTICGVIIALTAAAAILSLALIHGMFIPVDINPSGVLILDITVIILAVPIILGALAHSILSLKVKEYIIGDDKFTFTNGVIDRSVCIMQYDRVQAVYTSSGPIAHRFGLAKCSVSLLSAIGGSQTTSGYFSEEDLSKIADRMLTRISDGSYDYNKNRI